MEDQFLTLAGPAEGYFMDRGSKFLAYAFPVNSEEDAQQELFLLRKEHPKARHFCTALRLLPDGSIERQSDDGEPSGSAGRPILGQLHRYHLTQIFVVVVRYFGGTKLGVPGLIEAYKTSTANALETATIIKRQVYLPISLQLPYESFPHLMNHCKLNGIPVFEESFGERAQMIIGFPASTMREEWLKTLQKFTQMDFPSIEDYLNMLSWEMAYLPDPIIR